MNRNTIAAVAMKTVRRRLMLVIVALAGACTPFATALAQSAFFVERFMGAGLGVHLADGDSQFLLGKGYVDRSGNEGPASTNRHYLTTARHDYVSRDWTYDITFDSPASAPDDILFVGVGEAVPDASYFNEPRNSLNFRIHQGLYGFGNGWRVDVAAHSVGYGVFTCREMGVGNLPPTASNTGTFTARIRKSGNEMTFQILGTPILVTVPDVRSCAPFLNASNSRIFFGGASGEYLFSEMRVLPASVDVDHSRCRAISHPPSAPNR
jgi:hypothetical protein